MRQSLGLCVSHSPDAPEPWPWRLRPVAFRRAPQPPRPRGEGQQAQDRTGTPLAEGGAHQRARVRRRRAGRQAHQGVPCDGRPLNKEGGRKGHGTWCDTPWVVESRTTRSGTTTPVSCWPTAGRSTSCRAGWVTARSTRRSSTWSWCRTQGLCKVRESHSVIPAEAGIQIAHRPRCHRGE